MIKSWFYGVLGGNKMTDPYRKSAETEQDWLFPLEKILTVSARDYCESMGKRLSNYELRGVHVQGDLLFKRFRNAVPTNAEVVVDYKMETSIAITDDLKYMSRYAFGTALIPRPEEPSPIRYFPDE